MPSEEIDAAPILTKSLIMVTQVHPTTSFFQTNPKMLQIIFFYTDIKMMMMIT
jgi:hypothetical protein